MTDKAIHGSLDTNVLLRFVLGDVPRQSQAIERLLRKGGQYCVADLAIVEMVFVLEKLYHMPRDVVVDNVLVVINYTQFVCANRLFELALPLYLAQPPLSFMDCILLAYARMHKKSPLYTFDKALTKHSEGDARAVV